MANKNRPEEPKRKIYNRKILRNMLKRQVGSNKIKQAWHYLQETEFHRTQSNKRKKIRRKSK